MDLSTAENLENDFLAVMPLVGAGYSTQGEQTQTA